MVEQFLRFGEPLRITGRQVSQDRFEFGIGLIIGDGPGDQTDSGGFGCVKAAARQKQVGRRSVGEAR